MFENREIFTEEKQRRMKVKNSVFLLLAVLTCALVSVPVSAQWVTETVDAGGHVGEFTSIELDANRYPHISYAWFSQDDADLKYAAWNGSSWNIETPDAGAQVGEYTSLALDSNGNPHISYFKGSVFSLGYAKKNGSWALQTVEGNFNGPYTSIALDSNQNPRISYNYILGGLKLADWDGVAWNIDTVDLAQAYHTSLALDNSDYPHISYMDVITGDLKYAAWDGATWNVETVDSSSTLTGLYTSLALDGSQYPLISYYDQTNGNLKYAAWNGASWNIEVVDNTAPLVGQYTSLTLDASGYPHITYYDETNGDLKYAAWNGASWDIEIVDGLSDDVGKHTSLEIDPLGYEHISYYDVTNEDLKYAHWVVIVHDAGVISIDSPPDSVCINSYHTPCATVKNFGNVMEDSFKVHLNIQPTWKDSFEVLNLGPGDSVQVCFSSWQAPPIEGIYLMTVQTALQPDVDPGNNTDSLSMTVWDCPGIEEEIRPSSISSTYRLSQNNPNPFHQATTITFELPVSTPVSLRVYDLTGRAVRTLANREEEAGIHSVTWNGRDDSGEVVPSGIYLYNLTAGGFSTTRKMMFVR